jgi:hypothetical protein
MDYIATAFDHYEIKIKLLNWLENFVEKPNKDFNNWPICPFARQARLNNKIAIIFCDSNEWISSAKNNLKELDTNEVLVLCFDHTAIDPLIFSEEVKNLNCELIPNNFVALEDHPTLTELVNGVPMNFGHCALLVVQHLDRLTLASEQLMSKGYYNHWNSNEMSNVVDWRNR